MQNIPKRLLITTLVLLFAFPIAADVSVGSYEISGTVYLNEARIASDSLLVVYHYRGKAITPDNKKTVRIDKDGKYSVTIDWYVHCRSSAFKNCNGASRDSCLHFNSMNVNPDSIGFIYARKEIKFANLFWQYYKHTINAAPLNYDLRFVR